jgi:hypothetical protein
MKYKTEEEILAVVEKFESGTIGRADWGHAEHLLVAYVYASNHDLETALGKMRCGIYNLLAAFEIDLSKEMPYHETLTVFWMRTVFEFARSKKNTPLVESVDELITNYDKDYPLKFYRREVLFSDEARRGLVEISPVNLI